jgi:Anti sigma-E protein RseA, N-terminal domain
MSATHRAGKADLADMDLEQLSAWLDGELEPEQDRAMLDRLKHDPDLRAQFEWFNLAGDALRSHEVAACHHPRLVEQVREALKAEPVRVGHSVWSGSRVRRHIATGITVAAAAGVLVMIALPQLRGPEVAPVGPTAAVLTGGTIRPGLPIAGAPITGASGPGKALPAHSPQLEAYFRAHRELATTGVMPSAVAFIRNSGEPDR